MAALSWIPPGVAFPLSAASALAPFSVVRRPSPLLARAAGGSHRRARRRRRQRQWALGDHGGRPERRSAIGGDRGRPPAHRASTAVLRIGWCGPAANRPRVPFQRAAGCPAWSTAGMQDAIRRYPRARVWSYGRRPMRIVAGRRRLRPTPRARRPSTASRWIERKVRTYHHFSGCLPVKVLSAPGASSRAVVVPRAGRRGPDRTRRMPYQAQDSTYYCDISQTLLRTRTFAFQVSR